MKPSFDTERFRGSYYSQRLKSVFTAPTTGNYSFWVASDDHSKAYISDLQDSGDSSSRTRVVEFNSNCHDFLGRDYGRYSTWCGSTQHSGPVALQGGKDYLIEGNHVEWGGWDYFHMAVVVPGTEPSYNSLREVAILDVTADIKYEVQKIDVPATSTITGGFYILHYEYTNGAGTPIIVDVNMDALEHGNTTWIAEQLSFLGDIEVTLCTSAGSHGLCFQVEIQTLTSDGSPYSLMEARFAAEAMTCSSSCGLSLGVNIIATREQEGDAAIAGTFRISYGPYFTPDISWGAEAATVVAALEQIEQIPGKLYVVRSSYTDGNLRFFVEFVSHKGPAFYDLELNITGLTGGTAISGSAEIVQKGSYDRLLAPIPSYMLYTAEATPQLRVTSGGHSASCNMTDSSTGVVGSCPFIPSAALTPTITSVEEYLGPESAGDPSSSRVLVIRGTGFSDSLDGNLVTVAGEICHAMSAEPDVISCALNTVVTGQNNIIVTVKDKGLASHVGDLAPFFVVGTLSVTSVSPVIGSIGGGTYVTITGGVFPKQDPSAVTITFEEALNSGETSEVVVPALESITQDTIVFKAPANTELKAEYDNVKVNVGGQVYEFAFGYTADLTPLITGVSPNLVSAVEPTLLTITGQLLGESASDVEITLGGDVCVVRTISPTLTTCMWYPLDNTQLINCDVECERLVDGVPRTSHDLNYNVKGKGLTVGVPGALSVRVALEINSITPDHGSLFGGTAVTIRGAGFGTGTNFPTSVSIGTDYPASLCEVTFVNLTYIECVTRPVAQYDQELYQDVEATIRNVPTECKYIPYVPPDASLFYGLDETQVPSPPPPSGALDSLGTLSAVPPPPPAPPSPPLYESAYKTITYYGIGEVLVELPRTGPLGNWPFYGISSTDEDGTYPEIENPFPGVNYWQPPPPPDSGSRRRLLSTDYGSIVAYDMYGLPIGSVQSGSAGSTSDDGLGTPTQTPGAGSNDTYDMYGLYGLAGDDLEEADSGRGGADSGSNSGPPPSPPPPSPPPPPVFPEFPPPPPLVPSAGSCRFVFSEEYTPVVESVGPSPVTVSEALTITGRNFGTDVEPEQLTVYLVKVASASAVPVTLSYASQVRAVDRHGCIMCPRNGL